MTAARTLHIASDLSLPRETVTATTVIFGGKGMGKTNLGAVIAEELAAAGLRWAWLDPLGVSWGLRHSRDGTGPGVECLILGGPKGDLPIEPEGGAAVADVVVEESVNVLIDFSRKRSGEMWGVGEKIRFVTAYTQRLFQRQGELLDGNRRREPLCQILDEAARYIPQTIPAGNPQLGFCLSAWQQAVEEGRNIGLGVCLLTQRSARINKDVSELADALFAFRTVGPNSLQAIMDWLGQHVDRARVKDLSERVRSLEVGDALVVSPGWLRTERVANIRLRSTFDSSATPKAGERARTARGQGAKPDIAKIQARMAATIERAKAEDPKELRRLLADKDRRIRELEKVSSLKQSGEKGPPPQVKRVEVPILKDAQVQRMERAIAALSSIAQDLTKGAPAVSAIAAELAGALRIARQPAPEMSRRMTEATPRHTTTSPIPDRKHVRGSVAPAEGVSGLGQRILNALAWLDSIGVESGDRSQVALLANSKPTGGYYNNQVSQLRTSGLIEYPRDGMLRLTEAGTGVAVLENIPANSDELQAQVYSMVSGLQRRILEVLVAAYPEPRSREEVAAAAGADAGGGYFNNQVSALKTFGVIDYPQKGFLAASRVLFLEAR